jgi:hypothetical protein
MRLLQNEAAVFVLESAMIRINTPELKHIRILARRLLLR